MRCELESLPGHSIENPYRQTLAHRRPLCTHTQLPGAVAGCPSSQSILTSPALNTGKPAAQSLASVSLPAVSGHPPSTVARPGLYGSVFLPATDFFILQRPSAAVLQASAAPPVRRPLFFQRGCASSGASPALPPSFPVGCPSYPTVVLP